MSILFGHRSVEFLCMIWLSDKFRRLVLIRLAPGASHRSILDPRAPRTVRDDISDSRYNWPRLRLLLQKLPRVVAAAVAAAAPAAAAIAADDQSLGAVWLLPSSPSLLFLPALAATIHWRPSSTDPLNFSDAYSTVHTHTSLLTILCMHTYTIK